MTRRFLHSIRPLALAVLGATAAAGSGAAWAQEAGEPGYTPSRHRGVNVRSIPASPTAMSGPAAGPKGPSRGLTLRNQRRSAHPRGGTVVDVDPSTFPAQVARLDGSGKVSVSCTNGKCSNPDPNHTHPARRSAASKAKAAKSSGAKRSSAARSSEARSAAFKKAARTQARKAARQ